MLILFTDIISVVLMLYSLFRLYDSMSIEPRVKNFWALSGIFFTMIIVLDQIWQTVQYLCPANAQTDHILNLITCLTYILMPMSAAFIPKFYNGKRSVRIDLFLDGVLVFLILVPIINIWQPVIFYHQDEYMLFTIFYIPFTLLEYLVFILLVWRYYLPSFPFDRSDHIMVVFSLGIVGVGELAQIIYGDVTDNWNCISICYLFMVLALDQMYAKTDVVTKLHNRVVYLKTLRSYHKKKSDFTAVMFDLNHLKNVNDLRGHADGDAYLRAFGQTAQTALAPFGELFRIGGDEFCLLSKTATPVQLLSVLEDLQARETCDPEWGDYPLDFAFGLASHRSGEDEEETVRRADRMMYENKRKMHAAGQ